MTRIISICFMVVLLCTGCNLNAREEALRKKEEELTNREQRVSLREKLVALQEEEVLQLKQKLDSVKSQRDTALVYNQQLIGRWNVKMTCTETTCSGSAVGDTKTEAWDIGYENNLIVAKASANDKLERIYTGSYDGNTLALTENVANLPAEPTKMIIRLVLTNNDIMEGRREIVRENDCRIVYSLQLNREKPSSSPL